MKCLCYAFLCLLVVLCTPPGEAKKQKQLEIITEVKSLQNNKLNLQAFSLLFSRYLTIVLTLQLQAIL